MKKLLFIVLLICSYTAIAQNTPYTSYFTGNATDKVITPNFGITMMGGRTEHTEAMQWFINRANGGDVLVLRASGSDGYNNYLFNELGIEVNSVESIVVKTAEAANHPYVIKKIQQAEAIWLAGGDQYNYISVWGNSPMKQALQNHISVKKGAIGGTSAGMAVLGEWYFSAKNGSVTSEEALKNPYDERVQLGNNFLQVPFLQNTITDTHYADRNRQGRHATFMARITHQTKQPAFGIACDEYTAVCIGTNGIAHIYGRKAEMDNAVYFIQTQGTQPEQISKSQPLSWNHNNSALLVYKVITDRSGSATFNLKDWQTANGGQWVNWYVEKGQWIEVEQKD
ncbi:cyanophycinase [Roseivirga pacifica]